MQRTSTMTNVEWNNEMVFKIIDLYQARRLLWDLNHTDYKDKNKKAAAWHEIGHALHLDREAVQRKMKILTTQFQREYAKTSDPGSDYSSKWFAYTRLLFMKSSQPPPAAPPPHPAAVTSTCVAPYSNANRNIAEEQFDVEVKEEFDDDMSQEETYQPSTPTLYRKRAAPSHDCTPASREPPVKQVASSPAPTPATAPATSMTGTESRDEYSVFGEYVAMKLRKLHDAYARHKAQQEIHNILFSAEMGDSHPPINGTNIMCTTYSE